MRQFLPFAPFDIEGNDSLKGAIIGATISILTLVLTAQLLGRPTPRLWLK